MRILIADDHDLLRETLSMFLASEGSIDTALASTLDAALDLIQSEEKFDLIMLDYNMPGMAGLNGLKRAMEASGGSPVALMSGIASRSVAEEALSFGAAGFVPKTLAAKTLVNAVRFMAMGEKYAPIDFMTADDPTVAPNPLAQKLSRRELQVLEGLSKGKSNKEIARDLDLQEPTIKLHVKTLYRKIGAANRTQAALIAKEEGLF
ncbi:response regulator transcription factor [Paracoccaceae bacterium]|jgi:DNA-binding NarL/FixJ family response regulator|nr:response regulator transcription factor [Paracoccaceae bacterium]MED7676936.1 response regulator [Rhodobacteraceae bacterium IMCC15231]OAH08171.1 Transcriptional regulatory protein DegU [Rhodobacteraceae bacterium SB2]WQC64168.1 response regulator transcription factor [Alphaproteobacteria bacterium US3C007]MBT4228436.1 response regulator transcription factor [Paracoccaceae bacterium]|tara:strand:- start:1619 stop:2236 length:618 start_codon:yes stop_codon:yes gene_type:complete